MQVGSYFCAGLALGCSMGRFIVELKTRLKVRVTEVRAEKVD